MSQFSRLFYFEWKKICKRKGTWICLAILTAFYLVTGIFYFVGSKYVDGEFLETHIDGRDRDLANGRRMKGTKIDQQLLMQIQEAFGSIPADDPKYQLTDEYLSNVRPYEGVYQIVNNMLYNSSGRTLHVTEEELYEIRDNNVKSTWDQYGLTEAEIEYWKNKEGHIEKPFTYEYAQAYDFLVSMSGVYRVCLLVTFFIAVCMSGVFTEEHGRKTDQLILCSRLGRKQIYYAKIAAGSVFSLLVTVILLLCSIFSAFLFYGTDGFSAAIQLIAPQYSYDMTMGEAFLILAGILLLSSVMASIFTMILSELTKSSIASMAVVIAVMFLARLIPIPLMYRVISQAWNFMPINLLKFDAGFWDPRLVPVFGLKLTSWQFVPAVYILLSIVFLYAGKKIYCGYQVQGR
ncbi:MAG: ABC transporter permease subunit [Eubacterium sp.]|nr:ABC transporter permease subunit [Eubacterium sp.]